MPALGYLRDTLAPSLGLRLDVDDEHDVVSVSCAHCGARLVVGNVDNVETVLRYAATKTERGRDA